MDLFIFDRALRPFDENVAHEASAPVHRNRDASGFKLAGERGAGALRALNIRSFPCRSRGSSNAATQNPLSIVFDSRQARTA
jgi:hypothetical protein